ncbi:MAG: hypothetical protein HDKAJFGB_01527 [Anaerolineae bacterium]|nr:hypothetical protein [Anaerolineae bacterium]
MAEHGAIAAFQFEPQVHDFDGRQSLITHGRVSVGVRDNALRQFQQLQFAAARAVERFQIRRRAAENDDDVLRARNLERDLARVIRGHVRKFYVALVRGVMFFVNNDEPQTRQGRKERRTGPNDHINFAVANAPPRIITFADGQLGMNDADAFAKARAKAANRLRRQGDFGN